MTPSLSLRARSIWRLSWTCGLMVYLYFVALPADVEDPDQGPGDHDLSQHAIFCVWHQNWWSYCGRLRSLSISPRGVQPSRGVHEAHSRRVPVDGIEAAAAGVVRGGRPARGGRVARLVQHGSSTTISPDGPYGPPRILKKGVLHVALKSGVPVVPLTITPSRYISWPSWDSKKFPVPFSRIRVTVHRPIAVNVANFEEAGRLIVAALGAVRASGSRLTIARTCHGHRISFVHSGRLQSLRNTTFNAEHAEHAENSFSSCLCGLCVLCVERDFFTHSSEFAFWTTHKSFGWTDPVRPGCAWSLHVRSDGRRAVHRKRAALLLAATARTGTRPDRVATVRHAQGHTCPGGKRCGPGTACADVDAGRRRAHAFAASAGGGDGQRRGLRRHGRRHGETRRARRAVIGRRDRDRC